MAASAPTAPAWDRLDESVRREREAQYLRELSMIGVPGLTEAGIDAYLRYRHERPDEAITTYEEGQIRRLLRGYVDPARIPDPVGAEEHAGRLETFGATRLHLTNAQTYVAIMVTLNLVAVLVLLLILM